MDNKRVAHNFLQATTGGNYAVNDADLCVKLLEYKESLKELPRHKVALLFICLNAQYWDLAKNVLEGAKRFFLPGHDVDIFLWTDIAKPGDAARWEKAKEEIRTAHFFNYQGMTVKKEKIDEISNNAETAYKQAKESSEYIYNTANKITLFPTEALPWPAPTLYRYHVFLQQEQKLKDYDYIYYCDIDMLFANYIGDEIISDLVAAQHPMYALKKDLWMPSEPNPESTAYIKRPGQIINDNGKPRFMPQYYAGGFQGGKAKNFIDAWKVIKKNIDEDENKLNYHALWNEQAHWNKYLFDNPPTLVLTPSFIYPDSLIKEYYEPIWGCSYPPKLITLTKKFSLKTLTEQEMKELQDMKKL